MTPPAQARRRVRFGVLAAMVLLAATACRRPGEGRAKPLPEPPRDGRAAVEICVGAAHSCARAADGTVACWGDNDNHQVALSDEAQLDAPRVVAPFPRAVALRCAAEATCVLDQAGAIHCIGGGERTIRRVPGTAAARDFVLTGYAICARDGGGRVVCWDGPDGTPAVEVGAAAGATAFATAAYDARQVCVLRGEGAPTCFDARLWDPLAEGERLAVRGVSRPGELAGARALLVGGVDRAFVCGLRAQGEIACRRSTGGAAGGPIPVPWSPPAGETTVGFSAAYADTACTRVAVGAGAGAAGAGGAGSAGAVSGGVRCFGWPRSSLADAAPAGATALALSAGHACALDDGGVRCWGRASRGQLGRGVSYLHATPVRVPGVAGAVLLAAGLARACAAVEGRGAIACWGRREDAEDFAPVELPGSPPAPPPVLEIVPGSSTGPLCARWAAGWWCHNGFIWFPRPRQLATADRHFAAAGLRMRQIAADDACGVDDSGRLVCAGCTRGDCTRARARAALTSFDPGDRPGDRPRAPAGAPGTRFVQATPLYDHGAERFVCGLTDAGRVRCFHADKAPFERVAAPEPVREPTIEALSDIVAITAGTDGGGDGGDGFACALGRAGTVHCWGAGRFGQLGTTPVVWRGAAAPVAGLPRAAAIAAGGSFACARTQERQIYCWGSNREGTAPDGSPAGEPRPVIVPMPR